MNYFALFGFGFIGFLIGRVLSLLLSLYFRQKGYLNAENARTLIVLGSGGHTTEMIEIVKKLNRSKYNPRAYVVADGDQNSIDRVMSIEHDKEQYKIYVITRSRKVHQSYISSIFSTLKSIFDCIPLLLHSRPDLILCNGPSTCVPICAVAFLFKVLYINARVRIAFIESYCRVKSLSLSGWILLYLTDIFVVQWPDISKISRKVLYFGRLT